LGDVYQGSLKNNYLYQGAYAELDEDIGWHDFMLRNYDAQIGRWVQMDPFDEFASPYIGIGGDPINFTDPTGGFIGGLYCPGTSALAIFLDKAIYALSKTSPALFKLSIAISITKTALIVEKSISTSGKINGQIRTMQAGGGGNTYSTPDGGSITVPDKAKNLTFYDDTGVAYFDDDVKKENPFRVVPGSLRSFDFIGHHYDAIFRISNARFEKYGWNTVHLDFDEVSYRTPTVITKELKTKRPSVEEAKLAAGSAFLTMPGPLQPKVVAAAAVGATAFTLSFLYIQYTYYHFGITYPAQPFGGYLYSEEPPPYPGDDPSQSPGEGWEWRGKPGSTPGSKDGNWYKPGTGESLHPDLDHPPGIGPHWDWKSPGGNWYRYFPDGSLVPKI
jgi:RHS repeat-associated protein